MSINTSEELLDETAESSREKIDSLLRELEIDPDSIAEDVRHRLEVLEKCTPVIDDERHAIQLASRVFEIAEEQGKPYAEKEQRIVKIGTIFADIGKTGPREATEEQSLLIAEMYGKENIPDEDVKGSVTYFFQKYFRDDSKERIRLFSSLGLEPENMTMRDFYNLHSKWTLEIITGDGVPKEAVAAAACHHHLRGDNPGEILDSHDRYRKKFGKNTRYDRPEKLVNVLDLYDAYRRRGGKSREDTIKILRNMLATIQDGRYAKDEEFKNIIDNIEAVAGE